MTKEEIHELQQEIIKLKTERDYLIKEIFKHERIIERQKKVFNEDELKDLVQFINLNLGYDFRIKSRRRKFTYVRFSLANYIKEKYPLLTLEYTGRFIGINDHSTVLYALKQHKELIEYADYSILDHRINRIISDFYENI